MSEPTVRPGDLIAAKYRVERLIGEGGMGAVFEARHMELGQQVAIKVLLPSVASEMATKRFRREARAAARMRGDHVCRVLDVGQLDSGVPYMVMEYLEGCDLADELAANGPLPVGEAVAYVLQACEALAEAHAAGIVHRDLKPGNLFLANRVGGVRMIKVLDFGVSKMTDVGQPGGGLALTSTSMLVGSPLYMSPEQLESSRDVDGRTDVWALGVVLYELIAGRPPFLADSMPQLVNAVLHREPATFAEIGVQVPEGLEAVIRGALHKDRQERTISVAELAMQLVPFAAERERMSATRASQFLASGVPRPLSDSQDEGDPAESGASLNASGAVGAGSGPGSESGAKTPNGWERPSNTGGQPRRLVPVAIGIAVALLVGAGVWALWPTAPADVAEAEPEPTPGPAAAAAQAPETAVNAVSPDGVELPAGDVPPSSGVESEGVGSAVAAGAPQPIANVPQEHGTDTATSGETPEAEPGTTAAADTGAEPSDGSEPASDEPAQRAESKPKHRRPSRPAAPKPAKPVPTEVPAPQVTERDSLPDFGGRR